MNNEKKVRPIEYFTYAVGSLGKGTVGSLVATFALIYFTDCVGIRPALAGVVIFVSKVLVMLALPFAGMKMDKSQSKYGRFRPYLLWLSPLLAVVTAFTFLSPQLYGVRNEIARSVLCFCAYLLWETVFNLHDVPFWSLASVVSDREEERSVFLSIAGVLTTMAGIAPVVSVPYLVESFGTAYGYLYAGLIFGLCGGILASVAFFATKERITVHEQKFSVKESFRFFFSNRPMLIFDVGLLLSATVFAVTSAATYVGQYLYPIENGKILYPNGSPSFFDEGIFLTLLVMLGGGGSALAEAVFPVFFKKFGLKKTYFITAATGSAVFLSMFFVGYNRSVATFYLLLVFYLVGGFFGGMYESLKSNLIPECTDYGEWKTGVRQDGMFFSVQVMVSQLIESVPILAVSLVLQLCGYQEPSVDAVVAQSETVKNGIFASITLVPTVGMLLGIVPVLFYRYSGETRKKILAELAERRKQ